jgi:urate oxidase
VPGPAKQSAGGTASAGAGSGSSQAVDPLPATGRQVIRTASITLSVPNVTRTAADVRSITAGVGGYAGSENTQSDQADFTLQVPTTTLDQVLDRIAALGKVTDRGEQAQDVTKELVDVRSRVATQQASVDRVRALLAKATTVGDVVTIEGELSTREANLESLEQQQVELSAQVAMSTITVHIGQCSVAW